ncbi:hypothetical protein Bca52824_055357 [Brassica carinata]|uniref:Uncharacterized protein n=1 Tax=Brassica carinata TaxID=52824 RepID=A0A8X7R9S1_BRACI|nr:hypothetical protein Bca52824_055357 [Brassica carinata]
MEEEAQEDCHTVDHFTVDDLLVDFSNDDDEENDVIADSDGANAATAVPDNSNSSSFSTAGLPIFHGDVHDGTSFSSCVPMAPSFGEPDVPEPFPTKYCIVGIVVALVIIGVGVLLYNCFFKQDRIGQAPMEVEMA